MWNELAAWGLADPAHERLPRLVAVQSSQCAPVVRAFEAGALEVASVSVAPGCHRALRRRNFTLPYRASRRRHHHERPLSPDGKEFLALVDYKGAGLVVKLPRPRVAELIESGVGD